MATKTYGWFKMYWSLMDELTPEAALLFSYILNAIPVLRKKEGEFVRLSNSYIQECFQSWSDYTIKAKLDELEKKGYIEIKQKFDVEYSRGCRTRWVKPLFNPEDNPNDNPKDNPNNNP